MWFSRLFILFGACGVLSIEVETSTHWMVTESGLIQPRLDSPFDMARPYDLLAFLSQEKRWDDIFDIYNNLMKHQTVIDELWFVLGNYTDIGGVLRGNEDCVRAGNIDMIDWYRTLREDGSKKIPEEETRLPNPYYGANTDVPDCKRISSLTFSMFVFEHLEGMMQRDNLTVDPEFILNERMSPMFADQFGHWVTGALRRNSSSWLHYHMASLFWRLRGNAPKAVECCRRAVLYAPREYKDIALGSLGMVLYRSGKTNDAIIVLEAAVDHDGTNYANLFTLANVYTIVGEFDASLKYYNETLRLNPTLEMAIKFKSAVLCHVKLAVRIEAVREKLNMLRRELNEYTEKEAAWPKIQAEFLKTLKNGHEFDYINLEKNAERIAEITGINMREYKNRADKNSLVKHFIDGALYSDDKLGIGAIDTIKSLDHLIRHLNKNPDMSDDDFQSEQPQRFHVYEFTKDSITKVAVQNTGETRSRNKAEFTKDSITKVAVQNTAKRPHEEKTESRQGNAKKPVANDVETNEYETGIYMYPNSMQVNRNLEDFDTEDDWPSYKFCMEAAPKFPNDVDAVVPVFMPFENKGVRIHTLLTEKIGVPLSEEYDLPWHPPTCPQDKEATLVLQKKPSKQQAIVREVVQTGFWRQKLLEYVGNGNTEAAAQMQDAEIGQRIHVAMKKKLAPKWMLLTLASLYWRVRGNNVNALHCLLAARRWVQQMYRDIVLTSLASVYLEMGYFDEALDATEEAFKLSLYEPATNFMVAQLNIIKKNPNAIMFHLKQVVRVEPGYMNGMVRNTLNIWACIVKQANAIRKTEFGEACSDSQAIMEMVCSRDPENCLRANIPCIKTFNKDDTSALAQLMEKVASEKKGEKKGDKKGENKGDKKGEKKGEPEKDGFDIDAAFFGYYVQKSPNILADRQMHHDNFEKMVTIIDKVLETCTTPGCHKMKLDDLKEEDCALQYVQIGYWLQNFSFRQLFTDPDVTMLPSDIASMTPSNKKVAECAKIGETGESVDDFYLEKLSDVSSEEWEPVLSLMQQFAELFGDYDFNGIGAKIVNYVDTRPRSWRGALAAGWWCGASGRGACALRCLTAAHALAPAHLKNLPLRLLTGLLHMQSSQEDAKEVAYLALYRNPKSNIEAFLVAVAHTYLAEYDQAIWMYRYCLTLDEDFLPAKTCLHATMCLRFNGEGKRKKGA